MFETGATIELGFDYSIGFDGWRQAGPLGRADSRWVIVPLIADCQQLDLVCVGDCQGRKRGFPTDRQGIPQKEEVPWSIEWMTTTNTWLH